MSANTLQVQTYEYAMDIEQKFGSNIRFYQTDFDNLITVLKYPKTFTGQKKFFDVLHALSYVDLIKKINQVAPLINALDTLKRNKR